MNLREVAKFFSGLVVGDFLVGLWLYTNGDLPINFLGWKLESHVVPWWLGLDVAVFLGLVYYAWAKPHDKKKKK